MKTDTPMRRVGFTRVAVVLTPHAGRKVCRLELVARVPVDYDLEKAEIVPRQDREGRLHVDLVPACVGECLHQGIYVLPQKEALMATRVQILAEDAAAVLRAKPLLVSHRAALLAGSGMMTQHQSAAVRVGAPEGGAPAPGGRA